MKRADRGDGQIVLADVHACGAGQKRDIGAIVDDELRHHGCEPLREIQKFAVGQTLGPKLLQIEAERGKSLRAGHQIMAAGSGRFHVQNRVQRLHGSS